MDDTYQTYVNRVARLTLPDTYQEQLPHLQPSPKFQQGQPQPFPGFSVLTPPAAEDSLNGELYEGLAQIQREIRELFSGWFHPVPPESFHLTLADLVWDAQYRSAAAENPNFETDLKRCIQASFEQYRPSWSPEGTAQWQNLGLLVFPRALAVALVPCQESDYDPICQLRRLIYQNSQLIGLGIEQQYYFTAHITLGYFGDIPEALPLEEICQQLGRWNERWLGKPPQILHITEAQLRYFADMTHFERQPDYPVLKF
ncbi:MAG: DUF1868 domain-containing protein [Cyanobacteriota bacterium]